MIQPKSPIWVMCCWRIHKLFDYSCHSMDICWFCICHHVFSAPKIPNRKPFFRFLWNSLDNEIRDTLLGAYFVKFRPFPPKLNRNGDIGIFTFGAPKWGGYLTKEKSLNFTFFSCPYTDILNSHLPV
jgi:hypothetical protein